MKKIMFNDRYGLTQAVLNGNKTMTRRPVAKANRPAYHVGEEVAIAQSYHMLKKSGFFAPEGLDNTCESSAGYENKMFVRADLMPHRIRITDIRLELLKDISEEDAMREGVFKYDISPVRLGLNVFSPWPPYVRPYKWKLNNLVYRTTARYAFAYLFDKINGLGTWELNPLVYVYEFELLK